MDISSGSARKTARSVLSGTRSCKVTASRNCARCRKSSAARRRKLSKRRADLFRRIAPELVIVKPLEAEFAKLFNNAYRHIEFAATQSVLHDLQTGRRRLPGRHEGDEALIIRAPALSWGRIFRRSVPVQRHDATRGCTPAINSASDMPRMQVRERGLVLQLVEDLRRAYDLPKHDRQLARNGVQGRNRRYPRILELASSSALCRYPRRRFSPPTLSSLPTRRSCRSIRWWIDQRYPDSVHAAFRVC